MPTFNLVNEKWISCILEDRSVVELSLEEVLVRSHQVCEISHPSPLVVTGLHRLLLAVLHRNFGPSGINEWKDIWNQGRWDEKTLRDYFSMWHRRFDLFDPQRPFYQVPAMEDTKTHPIQKLVMEAASGNNATLFDHNFSARPMAFSPAQAVRYLGATQGYSIGFGKSNPFYFQDSPLVRGYTVFVIGNNLFESLALNLLAYSPERPIPHQGEDLPTWEQDSLPEPNPNGSPVRGYLDYLTWQSRRIHLFPEGDPTQIRYCQIQQNLKLPSPPPPDPFKCYRKEENLVPMFIRPEKALWRDSHTLFQAADPSRLRPEVFNWLARLRRNDEIGAQRSYRFSVTGLAMERGKAANVILQRHERLPLPLVYLENKDLLDKLYEAIHLAEEVERILVGSIWRLARLVMAPDSEGGGRQPDPREVNRLRQSLTPSRIYWSQLDTPFRRFLIDLADDCIQEEQDEVVYGSRALPEWFRTLREAATHAFEVTTLGLQHSARTLKAIAKAEIQFQGKLAGIKKQFHMEVTHGSGQ